MRTERRVFAWMLCGMIVWGGFPSIFAQTLDVPQANNSESSPRIVARLGSTRFDMGGPVGSVAWSPDGRFLATGVYANGIALWDSKTGQRVWQQKPAFSGMHSIHFSSDGKILFKSDESGHSAFDVATGQAVDLESLSGKPADLFVSVSRSNDGKQILLKQAKKETQKILLSSNDRIHNFSRFRLSPDRRSLAIGSSLGELTLWDVRDGRQVRDFAVPERSITALDFTPDGKLLVAACASPGIYVFDVESGERRVLESRRTATALEVDPQGKRLATAEPGSIQIWDLKTGNLQQEFRHPMASVRVIAFSPDGSRLAIAGTSGRNSSTLGIWDVATGEEQLEQPGHAGPIAQLTFSPDGRRLATASSDQTICLWEIPSGNQLARLEGDADSDLRFSLDGWMLGAAGQFSSYRLWEVSSGDLLAERAPIPHVDYEGKGRFSPELDRLAFGRVRGHLRIIETSTGKERPATQVFEKHALGPIAFSPNGEWLAVGSGRDLVQGSAQGKIVLWDFAQNKPSRELTEPVLAEDQNFHGEFQSLAVSADGRTLAAIDSRYQLILWELNRGVPLHKQPISPGRSVTFTPDGKTLLRLGSPSTLAGQPPSTQIEWIEAATAEVYRMWEVPNRVSAMALSPDGRLLAGALANSRQVLLWEVSPPASQHPRDDADLRRAVAQLASGDAQTGRKAMATLIAAGENGLEVLAPHLEPIADPGQAEREIQRLIKDLDSDDFSTRQGASEALRALGPRTVPALEAELKRELSLDATRRIQRLLKQLENKTERYTGESLRRIRGIEVLEGIGSAQAQELLKQLANGPASSPETLDARFALNRIQNRNAAR